MRRSTVRAMALLAVLAIAGSACTSSSSDGPSSDDTGGSTARPLQGTDGTSQPLGLAHGNLAITLPKGFTVDADEPSDADAGDCSEDRSTVEGGDQQEVLAVSLVAAACSTGEPQGKQGNGDYGQYVTMADVTDPIDPEVTKLPIGTLTVFGENRYICTNSCEDEVATIGLLELANPSDPAYPSVMLLAVADGDQRAQVVDAAKRLTVTP